MADEKPEIRILYRSKHDRMIGGVCGGVAEFFGIHSTLVRLLWVCLAFAGGTGFVAYIAAMILLPANPDHAKMDAASGELARRASVHHSLFWGTILLVVGIVLLLDRVGQIRFHVFWHHLPWDFVWPGVLVVSGLILILGGLKQNPLSGFFGRLTASADFSTFRRDFSTRKIWGVCSGLARTLAIDVNLVRILWVVVTFAAFPFLLILYLLIGLLTKDENGNKVFGRGVAGKPM